MSRLFDIIVLVIIILLILLCVTAKSTTYYVSTSGSDANPGTSWVSAWAGLTNLNDSTKFTHGDTAYFGTGTFRGTLQAIAGTFSDRTAYACSSFADTNGSGEYHYATITSADTLSGWTLHSGNIYKVAWTASVSLPQLFQSDSVLWRQTSLGVVTEGEWYYNGTDSIYAHIYGGGDPDTASMNVAEGSSVDMGYDGTLLGQDYITFYGLNFEYANLRTIECNITCDNDTYDSVFFDYCKFNLVMGDQGSNPGHIYSGGAGDLGSRGEYNRVRACSLSYAYAIDPTTYASSGNKGSGIIHYNMKFMTIDSNVFYGYFKESAIFFKIAYGTSGAPFCDSITIADNTFKNYENGSGIILFGKYRYFFIHGNVFDSIPSIGIYHFYDTDNNGHGYAEIFNNTFYNCSSPLRFRRTGSAVIWPGAGNEFKHNILYNGGTQTAYFELDSLDGDTSWVDVDSNQYYVGGIFTQRIDANTYTDSTTWRTNSGHDSSSTYVVDPLFVDAANRNFATTGAPAMTPRTYTDGRTYSKTGAIQDAPANSSKRMKAVK